MMKKKTILSLLLGMAVLPMMAETVVVNNTTRSYITYVPKNLGENRPLLISCHGMNQDANYQKGMLSIESVADTAKFVTVFPEGIDKSWDIGGDRDINFIKKLIDEMEKKYKIDRNRVYLSGFSMGGMFTYHAMNKIPDVIAAFAPISGYPMGGTTANANVRPIPIIHTHGTSDDVVSFSGVQGALNAWINHNHCPTTAKVVSRYRNASHITRRTWGPGDNGVEVVLMEMADKGHWISNDNGVKTGDEIWRFCKRFSLVLKDPVVHITSPSDGLSYLTFGGASDIPPITVTATASDPDGQVVKMAFYDNNKLIAEQTEAPYSCVIEGLAKGTHSITAIATDDEGNTGSSQIDITITEPIATYSIARNWNSENAMPEGWSSYDGSEHRYGFSGGYSNGPRLFHFTGEQHDFDWGLYTRNVNGKEREGYLRYGDEGTQHTLILYPGRYQLYYNIVNWNSPSFSPVTIAIETIDGQEIYAYEYTPTVNIGNKATNSFSGSKTLSFLFDVTEKGRYVITYYTADVPWADLVIGRAFLRRAGELTGISGPTAGKTRGQTSYFTLSGQPVTTPASGIYVEKTTTDDGTTKSRKVIF